MADDDCGGCRNGMREVTDVWARQEAGIPRNANMVVLAGTARAIGRELEEALAHAGERNPAGALLYPMPDTGVLDLWTTYVAKLNTVFPCPTCRPQQFARWRHGCYDPNHQPKRCSRCKEASR